jgi:hypothetical protein
MRRPFIAGSTALATTLVLASPALARQVLPEGETWYDGKPNHGGEIDFKVRDRRVKRIKGELPLPKEQTCQYRKTHRIPINIKENDPIEDGPFKIVAIQRVNPHTPDWRKLKFTMTGQFDPAGERASGAVKAKVYDAQGKCATRDDLTWRMHRRR